MIKNDSLFVHLHSKASKRASMDDIQSNEPRIFEDASLLERVRKSMMTATFGNQNKPSDQIGKKKSKQSGSIVSHRVAYKRGHKIDRNFYQSLLQQLIRVEESIPNISKMESSEVLSYKQKYISNYLGLVFKEMEEQCYEKALFMRRLWSVIRSMFEELIQKLCRALSKTEKIYLTQELSMHENYQNRLDELTKQLDQKQKQIVVLQSAIHSVALRQKEKNKKNKELAHVLIRATEKYENIEKIRDQIEREYINALTIGCEGGMNYEEAKNLCHQKFGTQWIELEKIKKNKSKSRQRKIYDFKQSNRPKFDEVNENIESENSFFNGIETLKQSTGKDISKECSLKARTSIFSNGDKKNQKTQVNIPLHVERKFAQTSLSNEQKFNDNLIRNKQIQTDAIKPKLPVLPIVIAVATQYCQTDIETAPILKKQKKIIKSSNEKIKCKLLTQQSVYIEQEQTENNNTFSSDENYEQNQRTNTEEREEKEEKVEREKQEKKASVKNMSRKTNQSKAAILKKKKPYEPFNSSRPSIFKRGSISSAANQHPIKSNKTVSNQVKKNSLENNEGDARQSPQIRWKVNNVISQPSEQEENNSITSETSRSSSQKNKSKHEKDTDEVRTDMLSLIENMSKLSPQGIFIDETMLFLLKKSLFEKKHDKNASIMKKNSGLINQIRDSKQQFGNERRSQILINIRHVIKIISNVLDSAYSILAQNKANEVHEHRGLNLLELLKTCIKKQYPTYKVAEIEHKILMYTKSMECYAVSNYMIKNFIFLTCLDDSVYSSVIFASDVAFYLGLLKELGKGAMGGDGHTNGFGSCRVFVSSSTKINYEQSYTTVEKLLDTIENYVSKKYTHPQLISMIKKNISEILDNLNAEPETRLDIYKCSQLILEALLMFKIETLKSYAKIAYAPALTPKGLITEELFIDLLGFLPFTKLQTLNMINKLRYSFGKKNTITGISLIKFVNFCLVNSLPDFDRLIFEVSHRYPIPRQLLNSHNIQQNLLKQDKLEKIAPYFYQQKQLSSGLSLLHCKMVEIRSSDTLQKMLGESLITLYGASLCLLEEKNGGLVETDIMDS